MPILEKKEIGSTEITGGKGTITPTPPPERSIEAFLDEHKKLKTYLAQHGGRGACASISELQKAGGNLSKERVNQHIQLFTIDHYVVSATEEAVCPSEAISQMMEMFKKMMEK